MPTYLYRILTHEYCLKTLKILDLPGPTIDANPGSIFSAIRHLQTAEQQVTSCLLHEWRRPGRLLWTGCVSVEPQYGALTGDRGGHGVIDGSGWNIGCVSADNVDQGRTRSGYSVIDYPYDGDRYCRIFCVSGNCHDPGFDALGGCGGTALIDPRING